MDFTLIQLQGQDKNFDVSHTRVTCKTSNYKNFNVKIGAIPSALLSLSSIISATIGQRISLLGSFDPSF